MYEAFRRGREGQKEQIEASLFKRAVGMEYKETFFETGTTPRGAISKTRTTVKYIPPDISAAKFWLTNKHPDEWTDDGGEIDAGDNKIVIRRIKAKE